MYSILKNIRIEVDKEQNFINTLSIIQTNITVTNMSRLLDDNLQSTVCYKVSSTYDIFSMSKLELLYNFILLDIIESDCNHVRLESIFSKDEYDIILDLCFRYIILPNYISNNFKFNSKYIKLELIIGTDGDFSIPISDEFKDNLKYLDTQEYKFTYLLESTDSIECVKLLYDIIKNIYNYLKNIDFDEKSKFTNNKRDRFLNFVKYFIFNNNLSDNIVEDSYNSGNHDIEIMIHCLNKIKVYNSDEFLYI